MYLNVITKLALTILVSTSLSCCEKKKTINNFSGQKSILNPTLYGISTGQITACPGSADATGAPPDSLILKTIRVIVPKNFDPANPKRDVKYKSHVNNEAQEDDKGGGTDIPTSGPSDLNPFSIDTRVFQSPHDLVTYVEIRVILKADNDYYFFETPAIKGVGFGDDTNNLHFCGNSFDTATSHLTAVFYIPMNLPPVSQPPMGSYNIGLVPKKAGETPVFIDPKVINQP
jgi:hypothetical protein